MLRRIKTGSTPDLEADSAKETFIFPETVCHRTLTGDWMYIPRTEIHQRMISFYTDACLNIFLSNPERLYTAHSKWRNA